MHNEINDIVPKNNQSDILKKNKNINAKNIIHFISNILLYSVLAILGLIILMFLAYFIDQRIGASKGERRNPLFGAYVIISNSMVPNINVNDAVVTMRTDSKNIKVNDIITFISKEIETRGTPITHRVVGIVYEDNSKKIIGYRTKGDHNNAQDFAIIKPDEVLGKVYLKLPYIGYIRNFLTTPLGWVAVVVIPCLFMIFSDSLKLFKTISKKKQM